MKSDPAPDTPRVIRDTIMLLARRQLYADVFPSSGEDSSGEASILDNRGGSGCLDTHVQPAPTTGIRAPRPPPRRVAGVPTTGLDTGAIGRLMALATPAPLGQNRAPTRGLPQRWPGP